jgi:hypothetical protein
MSSTAKSNEICIPLRSAKLLSCVVVLYDRNTRGGGTERDSSFHL